MSAPPRPAEEASYLLPLVLGKTHMPIRRQNIIRRDALLDRLMDDRERRITLVHAPAGYGKSTLLAQWAREDPIRRFGWVTLDDSDNDPARFWRYVLLAMRVMSPGFANRAWALLHQPQPDLDEVLARVLNSLLDVPGRSVLVLDDYHVMSNQDCVESLQYLIDHLPTSMHLALATRERPTLSLSNLQARGELLVIDRADLRFTEQETTRALGRLGRRQDRDRTRRVQEVTEGWPAGVYLSSISQGTDTLSEGAATAHTAVRSYLMEQMINDLEDDDRSVLPTWSILGSLTGDLCDHVTGRKDSAVRLEKLSGSNLLLMPSGADGDWYRLHDLLSETLQREFARLPKAERRLAHRHAYEWWLQHGDATRAIDHALAAGDYEPAAELFCAKWIEYMLTGWLGTLREWIDRFPPSALVSYPPMLVAAAWFAAFSGDVQNTHRFLGAAREASYEGPMPDGSASYSSALAILEAGLGLDGMEQANANAELAYELEPVGDPWRQMAAALAGLTRFGLGRYTEARHALTEAANIPNGPDGVATYARGQLALLEMTVGDWEEGVRQAEDATRQVDESDLGNLLSSGAARVAAAAAAAHAGNRGLAEQRLRALAPIQKVLSDAIPFDAFQINLLAAETYLVLENHRAARVHAATAAARLETFGDAGIFEERLSLVQSALDDHPDINGRPEQLTDRELEILELLQTDLSLRDIGGQLYVSRNTAKSHVASVYRKLGVTSRSAAVARARQLDLI